MFAIKRTYAVKKLLLKKLQKKHHPSMSPFLPYEIGNKAILFLALATDLKLKSLCETSDEKGEMISTYMKKQTRFVVYLV
jgi:hypothetical protein